MASALIKTLEFPTSRPGFLMVESTSKAIYDAEGNFTEGGQFEAVFRGEVQGSWSAPLDLGHYAWGFKTIMDSRLPTRRFHGAFYHGVTAEEFGRIKYLKPGSVRPHFGSDGVVRYICMYPGGCTHRSTSVLGAVDHEASHMGRTLQDLLNDPSVAEEVTLEAANASRKERHRKSMSVTANAAMGPGRARIKDGGA